MARDEMARDSERSLLDRPSHLQLADATAATLAATDVAISAGASADDTTAASASEKRQFDTGDGEPSKNEFDDITDFRLARAAVVEVHDGSQ